MRRLSSHLVDVFPEPLHFQSELPRTYTRGLRIYETDFNFYFNNATRNVKFGADAHPAVCGACIRSKRSCLQSMCTSLTVQKTPFRTQQPAGHTHSKLCLHLHHPIHCTPNIKAKVRFKQPTLMYCITQMFRCNLENFLVSLCLGVREVVPIV